ncbi:DUF433 domain-containing protein [Pseudonocardia saturnea]
MQRITSDSAVCHGHPTVRGLRYTVEILLELLSSGTTIDEVLDDYPDGSRLPGRAPAVRVSAAADDRRHGQHYERGGAEPVRGEPECGGPRPRRGGLRRAGPGGHGLVGRGGALRVAAGRSWRLAAGRWWPRRRAVVE